jgi:hypothetical protein
MELELRRIYLSVHFFVFLFQDLVLTRVFIVGPTPFKSKLALRLLHLHHHFLLFRKLDEVF